jgi:probable molybdopterin binding protein
VRLERVTPGRRAPARLVGAVLARDLKLGSQRWPKGRRLSDADLAELAEADFSEEPITVLVLEAGEMHEDDAAARLADAVAGRGLTRRGPAQSRIDLLAAHAGVLNVDVANLERINRIDPLEVFTAFDGQVVEKGDLVASVKVAPHVVPGVTVEQGARIAGFGSSPIVWVAPFVRSTIGVVVKQSVHGVARERFEESVTSKVEGLGSQIASIRYVEDDTDLVERALHPYVAGRELVDLVLTAGAASTDPADAFFVAIGRLGGRLVRRGVPAHPGSMLWLARVGTVPILGLPTCGAYSKATAADLLLPRLLTGEPPSEKTVARLGHGGLLTRDQRFRFPPYARELDAPDG